MLQSEFGKGKKYIIHNDPIEFPPTKFVEYVGLREEIKFPGPFLDTEELLDMEIFSALLLLRSDKSWYAIAVRDIGIGAPTQ